MSNYVMERDESKKALRRDLLAQRRALPPEKRAELSAVIQNLILGQAVWQLAHSVALYMPTQNEVDTALLLQNAWQSGKTVYLPRVEQGRAGQMHFARCANRGELIDGAYGILEPDAARCQACDFSGLPAPDVFLVPGVGFDMQGGRLGFGGGYYDRFLSSESCREHSFFLAVAYAFQVVDKVPAAEWDEPMHALCTEKGFFYIRGEHAF